MHICPSMQCPDTPRHALQQEIANRERKSLEVDLDDVAAYVQDPSLTERMEANTLQYLGLLAQAADEVMPQPTKTDLPEDIFDILLEQVGCFPSGVGRRACVF